MYVALVVLATVFLWQDNIKEVCNTVSQYNMEYLTCHLYFLGVHTESPKGLCVYLENTSGPWDGPYYTI